MTPHLRNACELKLLVLALLRLLNRLRLHGVGKRLPALFAQLHPSKGCRTLAAKKRRIGGLMNALAGIKWGWILLAAIAIEVVLFAVIVPLYFVPNGTLAALYLTVPACVIATFFFARWAANKAERYFVLHGLLVGVLAALMYWAISRGSSAALPTVYIVANYLKILAGAVGGYAAQRSMKAEKTISPASQRLHDDGNPS
jgi:hypothetical protein